MTERGEDVFTKSVVRRQRVAREALGRLTIIGHAQDVSSAMDLLLSPKELASWLGVATATLDQWRHRGTGPGFFRLNGRGPVRYQLGAVVSWLADLAEVRDASTDAET